VASSCTADEVEAAYQSFITEINLSFAAQGVNCGITGGPSSGVPGTIAPTMPETTVTDATPTPTDAEATPAPSGAGTVATDVSPTWVPTSSPVAAPTESPVSSPTSRGEVPAPTTGEADGDSSSSVSIVASWLRCAGAIFAGLSAVFLL